MSKGMRYSRIFHQILDSSLADHWQARIVFQDLILLADQDGIVDMTVNAIQRRTNLPLEIVEEGLKRLEEPDPVSRSPREDGRRLVLLDESRTWGWRIVNYRAYDQLRSKEDKRRNDRERIAEKRAAAREAAAVGEEAPSVDPQMSLDVATCREVSPPVASRRVESRKSPPLTPNPNPKKDKRTPCSPPSDRAEIEWRIHETWSAHCRARREHFETRRGRKAVDPTLTAEIRKAVSRSLREHDAHLLGADQRARWLDESKTRAAGLGIFLSAWHTGDAKGADRAYLEPWRPWKRQRGKPDPVEGFAELHFSPPRAPPRNAHAPGRTPFEPRPSPRPSPELPARDPTRSADWQRLVDWLRSHIDGSPLDPDDLQTWLGPSELWACDDAGRLLVAVPNEHFVHTIRTTFDVQLREGCEALGLVGVDFLPKEIAA